MKALSPEGDILANLNYLLNVGRVNLSINLFGQSAEFNALYAHDSMIMDAVYSQHSEEDGDSTLSSQIELSSLECQSVPGHATLSSAFWQEDVDSRSHQASENTIASLFAFNDAPATKRASELLEAIINALADDGLLNEVYLPNTLRGLSEHESVNSWLISSYLLEDSMKADAQLQGMGSCILAAMGATGAIIGVMNSSPELAVSCGGACGAGLVCLATVIGGGTMTAPCGVAIGSCATCTAVGLSNNFTNCFRHFLEMY